MKKALLILFGGRPMPNMLNIINQKPDIIVALVSQNEKNKLLQLQSSIVTLFRDENSKPELDTSHVVDAFDLNDIQEKCRQAVRDHPGYNWIFNITAATTVMSIGAYEVAKELMDRGEPIRCWYLDSSHSNVVALIGKSGDNSLFDINMDQYAAVYNRRLSPGTPADQEHHQYCQDHWLPFSSFLVQNPLYLDSLREALGSIRQQDRQYKEAKCTDDKVYHFATESDVYQFLEEAYQAGVLDYLERKGNNIDIKLSPTQLRFLDGSWLEVYVWNEARKLNLFSDCRWNQKIIAEEKTNDSDNDNELDVAILYKAQLIVIECKTGRDSQKRYMDALYKLEAVASPLGGNFVVKIFVSSQKEKDLSLAFKDKAKDRNIKLITQEELTSIAGIIEKRAKKSGSAR